MYPISPIFADFLQRRSRTWLIKADIAGTEYGSNVIVDFSIENHLTSDEEFEIGTTILSKLVIRLKTNEVIPQNARIVPYVSLSTEGLTWEQANYAWNDADFPWIGSSTDWLPLGEFFVDSREKINQLWTFTCYDRLVWSNVPYVSSLTYPTTMKAVWDEICTSLGYTYDSSVVINPSYQVQVGPAGFTKRQMLGYIASANGSSVFVGKNGTIKFKRYTTAAAPVFAMTEADYVRVKQTNPVKTYTRVVVTYDTEDGLTYEAGIGDENHTLYVENPFMTQAMTDALLSQLNGFSYMPIEMDARGYPQLEHGDVISFEQSQSTTWIETVTTWAETEMPWNGIFTYQSLILHQQFTFRGGLKMGIKAPSKSDQESEFVVEGTLEQQVNRLTQNAVRQGKNYYGVTITRTDGLIVEREDHGSKVILNSDKFAFQAGGVDKLYFDPGANQYKFTGVIEASSFIGGNITIGSGNNVFKADSNGIWAGHANFANAPFRVNMAGQMRATNGIFSGSIDSSTITGGVVQTDYSGSYPRIALSSSSSLLRAESSGSRSFEIRASYSGVPALVFENISTPAIVLQDAGGHFNITTGTGADISISAARNLYLYANSGLIRIPTWSDLFSTGAGQTLQSALSAKANASTVSGTFYVATTSGGPANRAITVSNGVITS